MAQEVPRTHTNTNMHSRMSVLQTACDAPVTPVDKLGTMCFKKTVPNLTTFVPSLVCVSVRASELLDMTISHAFADAFQIVGRQPVRENVLRRGDGVHYDAAASVHPFPSDPGAQRDDLYVTAAVYDDKSSVPDAAHFDTTVAVQSAFGSSDGPPDSLPSLPMDFDPDSLVGPDIFATYLEECKRRVFSSVHRATQAMIAKYRRIGVEVHPIVFTAGGGHVADVPLILPSPRSRPGLQFY